jgi:hypothetical protein
VREGDDRSGGENKPLEIRSVLKSVQLSTSLTLEEAEVAAAGGADGHLGGSGGHGGGLPGLGSGSGGGF